MQGQAQQQAYDRGITIFSPDGRLYQVEYAREAVKRGTASIGVRTPEGVVLAADKRSRSPLMEPTSVEKIHKSDDHIGIASAGHVADARQLIDFARRQSQVNRLRYGEPIGIETLTKEVTDHIQQYTQVGGARPFGVALLIGGIENGTPRLYETDPSGTPYEWKAVSIGADRGDLQGFLEENYRDDLTLDEGIGLALRAIASTNDDEIEEGGVDVATISAETEAFVELDNDEISDYIAENELEPSEEDDETDEPAE
ncbi:archaeal proteasome endopeptidase complex subunit alpha [Halogeometricum borinquense]|uniref:Proteasome subunit alpha n=2 Tax=Halogeometricum borinquense TaxID=60847 RepID=E4NQG8_HALBP|nr:archaeal proteasome endopeptidase complex subunit alpha [Halogeometricum borinquense]ADQ67841.1 proteasome endopeptidase complex, archaeal, alpha subunit [Halogeometricum borinquense DSM 11551]ELY23477.1 proteasome subunit alpha [Halogeometricum borinquense DSM 11551]QIB73584.1 archaeal proteasome endopeptidase complex subunit alpha [Halogeometricum borinquense]QIQ77061.1 archaeal proteasome endopeptidase complex subunit alpha [Halogeometricum borinquense]RYJ14615.1 archaeal proteasome endo